MYKAFESAPTSINFNETYTALQTKVVDGQENLPARALAKGRYRVVVSLVAAVNPGPASRKASLPFVVQ